MIPQFYMNEDEIQNLLEQDEPILKENTFVPIREVMMLNQNVTAQDIQVRQMAEVMGPKSILETSCDSFGVILGAFLIYGGFQFSRIIFEFRYRKNRRT